MQTIRKQKYSFKKKSIKRKKTMKYRGGQQPQPQPQSQPQGQDPSQDQGQLQGEPQLQLQGELQGQPQLQLQGQLQEQGQLQDQYPGQDQGQGQLQYQDQGQPQEQDPNQYQDPSQYQGQDQSQYQLQDQKQDQDPSQYQLQDPGQEQGEGQGEGEEQGQEEGEEPSNENKHPGIIGPAIKVAKNLANKAASLAFSGINSLTGVNIEDKESTNNALENAYNTLSDPEVQENISRVFDASTPAINKFMEKTTDAIEKSADKVGEAAISVALNTVASVPGVGAVIGAIRSLDKGAQAAQSVFNSMADTTTAAGDAAYEIKHNLNNPQSLAMTGGIANMELKMKNKINERNNIQKFVGGSIAEFQDTTLNPEKFKTKINNVTKRKKSNFKRNKSRRTRK